LLWRLALAAWILVATACSPREGIELRDWTLEVPGQRPVQLHLPAHVDGLVGAAPSFVLRAKVALPPDLRAGALTLTSPKWYGLPRVSVDGVAAWSLEDHMGSRYRSPGWNAWHLERREGAPAVDLALAVERSWDGATWIDAPLRLSQTPRGDAFYLGIKRYNELASQIVVGFFAALTFVYFVSFCLGYRRAVHGWFIGMALGATLIMLHQSGKDQFVIGNFDVPLLEITFVVTGLCAVYYTHAYFRLGLPPRVVRLSWWTLPLFTLFGVLTRREQSPAFLPSEAALFMMVAYCCVRLVRLWRVREQRVDALIFLCAWAWCMPLVVPESIDGAAGGTGIPYLLTPIAFMGYGLLQMFALSRDRLLALAQTDALNVELRHQVLQRSHELAAALARIEGGSLPRTLKSGAVFAQRYQVIKTLGSGAMGVVYEVERLTDHRRLALKLLVGSGDRERWTRLALEANHAAKVNHPNVVVVHDVGVEESAGVFVVMELVAGSPLEAVRARFGDRAWARPILGQLAAGLSAIHRCGVVHRDLKPANVLISGSLPSIKIADFGLAGLASGRWDQAYAETLAGGGLTRTGMIMGTPFYMAPELHAGAKDPKPSSDVYSFGVMAHELMTGVRPAHGHAGAVLAPTGSPAGIDGVPAAIVEALRRCLHVDPGQRPTATELEEILSA